MTTLDFEHEHRYEGDKAMTTVTLVEARRPTDVEMVLDTGSGVSLLNRAFIAELGLSIEDGEPIELRVANGDASRAWIHPVEIDVFGRRMTIQVAFCPDWNSANLLGMRGFFDQIVVAFDHAERRVYF